MAFQFSTIELKDDTIIIVLGASGDLAKKKTVCASLVASVCALILTCSTSSPHYSVSYVPSDNDSKRAFN